MDNRLVITIGRQCGSGGRRIGQMLAEQLGIKCYDKEILNRAAKESGLAAELFETHDEKPTSSFLYSLVMDTYSLGYTSSSYMDMPINHKIFLAQFDTIKKLASEESCIIVGRCADYALADDPNAFSVFITGNDEDKIKRIMETNNIEANKAKDNYYSSKRWADSRSYDLTVNSSTLGLEGSVELIKTFAKIKGLL